MNQITHNLKDPLHQGIFAFIAFFLFEIIVLAISTSSPDFNKLNYWIMAGTILMLFAIANAIGILQAKSMLKYWSRSMYAYIGLLVAISLVSWAFSGLSVGEAASIRWIFMIITLCYVLFLIIVFLMKVVIDYAQKQDLENR